MIFSRTLRYKELEITNHLGSVITTLSDRRLAIQSAGSPTAVDYYFPNMLSTSDYYAFGMQQPERNYSSSYRYLFGGQEADNEVHNNVNNYTAEYWQYDARLGRRWENDPIVKPWESPYAAFANNPIWYVDPYGLDKQDPNNKHDDNGDGVSGPGEGCDNTTGTWETHSGNGYSGQTAPPVTLPEVDTYSGPEGGKTPDMNPLRDFDMMREHMGDDNPYMFSRQELRNAANAELSAVLSVIPVGQFVGLGKIAGFALKGTVSAGVDYTAQMLTNGFDNSQVNLTSVGLSFAMQGTTFGQILSKNFLSAGVQFKLGEQGINHQIIGIDNRDFGAVTYNTFMGTAFDFTFAKFSAFDTKINTQYVTRLQNLSSSKPKYVAELLHYRKTMFYKTALKGATTGALPDFMKGVTTNELSRESK